MAYYIKVGRFRLLTEIMDTPADATAQVELPSGGNIGTKLPFSNLARTLGLGTLN